MANLYRKSLLDRLSTPERLDRTIVIVPPSFWIAMAGLAVMLAVALVWSVFARLPIKVEAGGLFVSDGGVTPVYAMQDGMVVDIPVQPGQQVAEGDVLVRLANEELAGRIAELRKRIDAVAAVRLEGSAPAATADNRELLEIKAQYDTLHTNLLRLETSRAALAGQVREKNTELAAAQAAMEAARQRYYDHLQPSGSTAAQLAYQEAQAALAAAQEALAQTRAVFEALPLVAGYAAALQSASVAATGADPARPPADYGQAVANDPAVQAAYNAMLADAQAQTELAAVLAAQNGYTKAQATSDAKKTEYENSLAAAESLTAEQQKASDAYSQAGNAYSLALQAAAAAEDALTQTEIEMAAERTGITLQAEALGAKFTAARETLVSTLDTELDGLLRSDGNLVVTAGHNGVVQSIQVRPLALVGAGTQLAQLERADGDGHVVVCYVPLSSGKKIQPGMEMMVYPSTVNEQEYGHMPAAVLAVSPYMATQAEMLEVLGDEMLVNSFLNEGPVVAVTARLEKDPATASGYAWSSAKGADILLEDGTPVNGRIVTERKAPISMLLPYLREKFTVREGAGS